MPQEVSPRRLADGPEDSAPIERARTFIEELREEEWAYLVFENSYLEGERHLEDEKFVRRAVSTWNTYAYQHNLRIKNALTLCEKGILDANEIARATPIELKDIMAVADAHEERGKLLELQRKLARLALSTRPVPPEQVVTFDRLAPLVEKLLEVVAAQQLEIEGLREQIGRVEGSKMVVFNKNEIIEQVHRVAASGVGVRGFRAELEVEEEESAASEDTTTKDSNGTEDRRLDADAALKLEGLVKYVAGLDVGGKIKLAALAKTREQLEHLRKHRRKNRSRVKVHVEIGELVPKNGKT